MVGNSNQRSVSLNVVPKVHDETALQRVGGRWVAATPDERLHSFEAGDGAVSEVAERIVELIDGRRSIADIVQVLVSEFDVDDAVAQRDTLDFIGLLADKQVLVL
ncbi:MAG: PqqD family protein [Archangium gephyra]|uniref:PqqD family protein n=1 Tax=Archangium gephyra TaxID=48 RepID=A0A2W5U1Z1_9BACT|nr:MAG: PqqD family protein [Archangium gephyra]